jgi:DNA-binding transcriptional MerR regulator
MAKEETIAAVPIKKAAELSGLTTHMLTYLGRIDVLTPSGNRGGRGRRRLYTFSDVLFLRMISEMLMRGIEVKRLGAALKRVKVEADDWLDLRARPRHFMVTDGTEVMLRRRGQLESKTMNGQLVFAFVLDIAAAHKPLAEAWPRIPKRESRA